MTRMIAFLIFSLSVTHALAAAPTTAPTTAPATAPSNPLATQRSRDGDFEVQAPENWKSWQGGLDIYDIYLCGPARAFLFCNSDAKEDFAHPEDALNVVADQKIESSREWIHASAAAEPQSIRIGEYPAVRCEVRGESYGRITIHVLTIMEMPTRIVAWVGVSYPSKIEQHRQQFEQIVATTRDVPPTPPAPDGK
jgi:hypothetical protein